jgi:Gpi18-like mannosyltransferase
MRTRLDRRLVSEALIVFALIIVAVLARYAGRHEQTRDMYIFQVWYDKLRAAGGWRGLGKEIGNYNAPFLYLLWFSSFLPGSLIIKIKLVWTAFDVLLAFFAYQLAALRWGRRPGVAAALVTVLLPTVVINASFYGQMDAMWTSFALGGVYFLARNKPWHGVAFLTVALALKPQGIFLLPLLGLLVLAGAMRLKPLLAAPVVWLLLDVPALLLGRDPIELLTIYAPTRQSSIVSQLTASAPSAWAFFPVTHRVDTLRTLGYLAAAAAVLGLVHLLVMRRIRLDATRIVTAAAVFSIMVPFLLPGMHERYFFLADVLSLMLAVHRPQLWYVPLLVQASSLLSYEPFLLGPSSRLVNPMIPAAFMLAALIVVTYTLVRDAFDPALAEPEPAEERREPEPAAEDPAARRSLVTSRVGNTIAA